MTNGRIDRSVIATGPKGEIANRRLIEHGALFEPKLHRVGDRIWCMVGVGLANITFVAAPDGLIVIDSGESCEEAAFALEAVREVSGRPIVGVLYSHFHYVQGTKALLEGTSGVPVWGHADVAKNLAEMGAQVGPVRMRGLVGQMGIDLPTDGPDSMPNIGIGPFWRDPQQSTVTRGFVAPTHTVDLESTVSIGGLDVRLIPAPSDSDDTLIIWIPELRACINNHVWPALFNIYPLRGEPYRDPLVLLRGLQHIIGLDVAHLVGVHGPPLSGVDEVRSVLIDYHDALRFIYDQTVRAMNMGMELGDIVEFVRLPERFDSTYFTEQFYGLVAQHVRQVHAGVRGWFDGHSVNLFPLTPADQAMRLVAGFGGREAVLAQGKQAFADDEMAWVIELMTWLLRLDADDSDASALKSSALRSIAQTTTSANVRSWCLTEARELEGLLSLDRFRGPIASFGRVLGSPPATFVGALQVQVDPVVAAGVHSSIGWRFADGTQVSLRIRDGVALVGDDVDSAETVLELDLQAWAELYSGKRTWAAALEAGNVALIGDRASLQPFFACFDHPHLKVGCP